jgi:hypothetical protein
MAARIDRRNPGPITLISEAVLTYLYPAPAGRTSRWKSFRPALSASEKSLIPQYVLAICKTRPRWSSKSGPMVGDSSTADYRVLDEVIDIAHLVLEMSHFTDHVKPSLSGRFPKL